MPYKKLILWMAVLAVLFSIRIVSAQGDTKKSEEFCSEHKASFDIFFNCIFSNETTSFLGQKEQTKQVEITSIAENTTSLVDQTAAPDVMGLALNLIGQQTKLDSGNNMAGSVTFSAYSLYAGITGNDPLNPGFYNSHRNFRRFSFTIGQDNNTQTNAASKPAMIYGAKILLLNNRDLSTKENRDELEKVAKALRLAAPSFTAASRETKLYLYNIYAAKNSLPTFEEERRAIRQITDPSARGQANIDFDIKFNDALTGDNLSSLIKGLTDEQQQTIRAKAVKYLVDPANFVKAQSDAVDKIRRKPQLSLTFQSKQRSGTAPDEYRAGLLFDYGVVEKVNLTFNGTYDYKKSHIIGGDQKGGRFAVESNFQLMPTETLAGPKKSLLFSIAGEAKWMNAVKPTYTGQAKISIPLYDGISFPISISYGNRPDLVQGNYIRGNFGLTFDLGKLLAERLKQR